MLEAMRSSEILHPRMCCQIPNSLPAKKGVWLNVLATTHSIGLQMVLHQVGQARKVAQLIAMPPLGIEPRPHTQDPGSLS
jgi:hypothetical protein